MRLTAVVLHNVGQDMFFGYGPTTSTLHHAHTFEVEADNISRAADLIYILTNVGSADELRLDHSHLSQYANQVIRYRERLNRSLSVGDVIVFYEGERSAGALACATVGWATLRNPEPDFTCSYIPDKMNATEVSASYEAHEQLRDSPPDQRAWATNLTKSLKDFH